MPVYGFDPAFRERLREHLAGFDRCSVSDTGLRSAAVAVAVVPGESLEACFVLTRRAARLKRHGGQWALPGGRCDAGETAAQTALRELKEEVGLSIPPSGVLGLLDDYATRSGFVITPVVVWGPRRATLEPNADEVAYACRVPFSDLDAPEVPRLRKIPESERPVISIPLAGTHVHAPTAAILYQAREAAVWGRPTRVAHFEQPVFAWR